MLFIRAVRDVLPFSSTIVCVHDDIGRHFVRLILVCGLLSFFLPLLVLVLLVQKQVTSPMSSELRSSVACWPV